VLIRAWLAAGRPEPSTPRLGSYEAWSVVMGGVLEAAGIEGFLSNLAEAYEQSDMEDSGWLGLAEEWWATYGDRAVAVREVLRLIERGDIEIDLGEGGAQSRKTRLGIRLAAMRDRRLGTYVIRHGGRRHGANRWRLEGGEGCAPCDPSPPDAREEDSPGRGEAEKEENGDQGGRENPHNGHNPHNGGDGYDAVERDSVRDEGAQEGRS
jgi:hypothetical protein